MRQAINKGCVITTEWVGRKSVKMAAASRLLFISITSQVFMNL